MSENMSRVCSGCTKTVKCPSSNHKGEKAETKTSKCQTGCTEKNCHTFSAEVHKICGGCTQIISP